MIYKVQGNFDLIDFDKVLEKVCRNFKFIYQDKVLYIALKSYDKINGLNDYMKDTFKPSKNFFIQEITEKNILELPDEIGNWCKDNFVSLQKRQYEIENQEKLRKVSKALDYTEIDLKNELDKINKPISEKSISQNKQERRNAGE